MNLLLLALGLSSIGTDKTETHKTIGQVLISVSLTRLLNQILDQRKQT